MPLTIEVTGSAVGVASATRTSAPTGIVTGGALTASVPGINGAPAVGQTLLAIASPWQPGTVTLSYQWKRDGVAISGATKSAYLVQTADVGAHLSVFVTGARAGFDALTVGSDPSATVVVLQDGELLISRVEGVGRGIRVEWTPDTVSTDLVSYSLIATPASGGGTDDCPTPAAATLTVDASNSGAIIPALCPGVPYSVKVRPVYTGRVGPLSAASLYASPWKIQPADAPLLTSVTGRDGAIEVEWDAPDYDGGSTISAYSITASDGTRSFPIAAGPTQRSAKFVGLTNGTTYTVAIVAENAAGDSQPSNGSAEPETAHAPSVPTSLSAQPDGAGRITVTWGPPSDDGGSDVYGYDLSYVAAAKSDSGTWVPADGATVHELSLGQAARTSTLTDFEQDDGSYLVTVSAVNGIGEGATATTPNPVAPRIELSSATIVMTAATADALTQVSSDSDLTWPVPSPIQLDQVVVGSVLVAPVSDLTPGGLLRKVTAVSRTDKSLVVSTSTATLDDAFDNLALSLDTNSTTVAGAGARRSSAFRPTMAGVSGPTLQAGSVDVDVFSKTIQKSISFEGGVCSDPASVVKKSNAGTDPGADKPNTCITAGLSADMSITPSVGFGVTVTQNMFGIPDGVAVAAQGTVESEVAFSGSVQINRSIPVAKLPWAPIVAGPIVIVPTVSLEISLSGTLQTSVTISGVSGAGMAWDSSDSGRLQSKNLTRPFTATPGVDSGSVGASVAGSGSVAVVGTVQFALYGVAGPYLSLAVKATITFDSDGKPWASLKLTVPMRVGLKLDIFVFSADLGFTFAEPTLLSVSWNAPAGSYAISPASPVIDRGEHQQLSALRSDGVAKPLTWTLTNGSRGDSITPGGLFTASSTAAVPRTVTVAVKDSDGAGGKVTVAIGVPVDAPATAVVSQSATASATVTWTSTSNRTIGAYRVVLEPNGTSRTVAGDVRSTTFTGLQPSHYYSFAVYTVSAAGVASEPRYVGFTLDESGALVSGRLVVGDGLSTVRTTVLNAEQIAALSCFSNCPTGLINPVDVACGTAHCVAVGGIGIADGKSEPFIAISSGGNWKENSVAAPAGARSASLSSVSCHLETCAAVGSFVDDASSTWRAFAIVIANGAVGPLTILPVPDSGSGVSWVTSVSCGSAGCAVSGYFLDDAATQRWLVERYVEGAWSAAEAPLLAGTSEVAMGAFPIDCNGTHCVTFATTDNPGGSGTQVAVATLADGGWSTASLNLAGDVSAVSCRPDYCAAIGWTYAGGHNPPVIAELHDGTWSTLLAPLPSDGLYSWYGNLANIDCTSSVCVAVGQYIKNNNTFGGLQVRQTSSGAWVADGSAGTHFDVACLDSKCVASTTSLIPDGGSSGSIARFENDSWTAGVVALPVVDPSRQSSLDNIACNPTFCATLGMYAGPSGNASMFLGTFAVPE